MKRWKRDYNWGRRQAQVGESDRGVGAHFDDARGEVNGDSSSGRVFGNGGLDALGGAIANPTPLTLTTREMATPRAAQATPYAHTKGKSASLYRARSSSSPAT